MKKRHSHLIAAALVTTAILGIGASPALADPTSVLDDLGGDVALQASGDVFTLHVQPYASNESAPTPTFPNGVFVGLTQGFLTDSQGHTQSDPFYMFCVDFNDDITVPISYNVIVQGIASTPSPDNLGETLQELQEQALLGANFGSGPATGNTTLDAAAQFDIWNLNNPAANIPVTSLMQSLLDAAVNAQPNTSFSNNYLFDPTSPSGGVPSPGQAFMPVPTGNPNTNVQPPVPEPGTWAMLGLGLIGLGSLKLRSSRR